MKKETIEMMDRIMDSERMGYAYLYPNDGSERKEYLISTTLQNMANFIGSHPYDAEKMIITDMCDRLLLDTAGGFLDNCPNQDLCRELIPLLAPIQMGEKEAGDLLILDRIEADAYFNAEEEVVMQAELSMM